MGLTPLQSVRSNYAAASEHQREAAHIDTPLSVVPLHMAVAGRARLMIGGMRGAPALASLLERGLTGFAGVQSVSANPLTGNLLLHYDRETSLDHLIERIGGLLRGEIAPAAGDPTDRHWHAMNAETIASELGSSCAEGLPSARAKDRLAQLGGNSIPPLHQRSDLSIFLGQFQSLPVALLACVAVVSLATGTVLEAGAIAAVVGLNAAIGFTAETRAERSIRSLGAPTATSVRVVRGGLEVDAPAETLVPGDVVILQQGTVVPA